jgi:lysine-specific demethylase 3
MRIPLIKFQYDSRKINGILTVNGFLDPHLDPNEYDLKLWERLSPDQENLQLDGDSIKYLLTYIATQFCELIEEEREAYEQHLSEDKIVAWKRSVAGVREMCDVCETSLFNYHWTCQMCGFSVCPDCYKDRKKCYVRIRAVEEEERKTRDRFYWYKCTNKEDHDIRDLMLTQIIAGDALDLMNKRLHEICQQWNITQSCGCLLNKNCVKKESTSMLHDYISSYNVNAKVEEDLLMKEMRRKKKLDNIMSERKGINPTESKVLYSRVAHEWLCDGKVLRFMNPLESDEAYKMFQDQWELGQPILISNCTEHINRDIWHPQIFLMRNGQQKNLLVNCINGEMIHNQQMLRFWEGFMEIRQRLRDKKTNRPMVLKLKDWPPSDDFAEIIPEHFTDLRTCLPLPAYTARNGKFNLASHLPDHFVKPDLGPKMYSAYGQTLYNNAG